MKLNPFVRFGLLFCLPAIVATGFLIQLFDPSLFGQKHTALCWIVGIVLLAFAFYNLYLVAKNSNTGSPEK